MLGVSDQTSLIKNRVPYRPIYSFLDLWKTEDHNYVSWFPCVLWKVKATGQPHIVVTGHSVILPAA